MELAGEVVKEETGIGAMADILGYARISTHTQDLAAQKRRLQEEGALRMFEDVVSGRTLDRRTLRVAARG